MRVAIIGGGIAGLGTAWYLNHKAEVTLFEAQSRLGGHAHTHRVADPLGDLCIDTGFIVFNQQNYPLFSKLLADLDVQSQLSDMSFGVIDRSSGVEYAATSLDSLFCQRGNLLAPAHWRMLWDIRRFYAEARAALDADTVTGTVGDWLDQHGYGQRFVELHLIPMISALWSAPGGQARDFPMRHLLLFFEHHQMLQISGRPQWRTVCGGSQTYVHALRERLAAVIRTACPVRSIERDSHGYRINREAGRYDHVVLACHSDQAAHLLRACEPELSRALFELPYQTNEVVLHHDESVLPENRKAWAAWNVRLSDDCDGRCTVSYNMNILQNLQAERTWIVSLNQTDMIASDKVEARMSYEHPVYAAAGELLRASWAQRSGHQGLHLAGAYWGWGFHEDGMRSAQRVAQQVLA